MRSSALRLHQRDLWTVEPIHHHHHQNVVVGGGEKERRGTVVNELACCCGCGCFWVEFSPLRTLNGSSITLRRTAPGEGGGLKNNTVDRNRLNSHGCRSGLPSALTTVTDGLVRLGRVPTLPFVIGKENGRLVE